LEYSIPVIFGSISHTNLRFSPTNTSECEA
jgi:hypothetical protein